MKLVAMLAAAVVSTMLVVPTVAQAGTFTPHQATCAATSI